MIVPIGTANTVLLSWNARTGAGSYQVFLRDQSQLTPIFAGIGTSCTYSVPSDTDASAVLAFDVRSLNMHGLVSDMAETSVTNEDLGSTAGTTNPVVVQVGGVLASNTVTGPTNLTLSAEVNVTGVQQVSFYSDGQLIGTANDAPFQMTWYHVPGTVSGSPHIVTAVALATSQDASTFISGGSSATFTSDPFILNVNVEPVLAAYQTSATDLQLPAPGFPISLSRSYTSRSTDTNGVLGVGWTPGWNSGSVKLSHPLGDGWQGITQTGFGSAQYCFISDNAGHFVTVTLPNGQTIGFAPQLEYDTNTIDGYPSIEQETTPSVRISFQPFAVNSGVFTTSLHSMALNHPVDDALTSDAWNGDGVQFVPAGLSQAGYTSPDGTVYEFGQQADTVTWLLTKITDRSSNSLIYTYDSDMRICSASAIFADAA